MYFGFLIALGLDLLLDSDLLKRHAANHPPNEEELGSGSGDSASKRRKTLPNVNRPRAFQACRACAASKLRCEGSQPCYRCQEKSLACEYPQSRAPRSHESAPGEDEPVPDRISQEPEPSDITVQMDAQAANDASNQIAEVIPQSTSFQLPTPMTFGQSMYLLAKPSIHG